MVFLYHNQYLSFSSLLLILFLCIFNVAYKVKGVKLDNKPKNSDTEIKELPGWPYPLPSKQFSGYVNGTEDGNMQLHYWFIECEEDPSSKPVVLWFNGGPGASSLYGLLLEIGPLVLSDESLNNVFYETTGIPQMIYNPYSWSKAVNILAISMPPPVGFGYCNGNPASTGTDCGSWNDTSTAEVTFHAIKTWFLSEFPSFQANDIYILGESYAGIYIPEIVKQILAYNKNIENKSDIFKKKKSSAEKSKESVKDNNLNSNQKVNLVGFGVGDACTPPAVCGGPGNDYWQIEFLYGKGAFSNKLYEEIQSKCSKDALIDKSIRSQDCQNSINKIDEEVGGYWVYAYYDECWYENDIRRRQRRRNRKLSSSSKPLSFHQHHSEEYMPMTMLKADEDFYDQYLPLNPNRVIPKYGYACGGTGVMNEYLDLSQVKAALNLPDSAEFFQCDNGEGFDYDITEKDLISWYKEVLSSPDNNLKIMVYNGDTDPAINAFVAQNWTRNLGFDEIEGGWRPWTTDNCQRMGGYITRYENNFDFVQIKGSGHMVPEFKGQAALEMLTNFVFGSDYKKYDATCTSPPSSTSSFTYGDRRTFTSNLSERKKALQMMLKELEMDFKDKKDLLLKEIELLERN